MLLPHTLLLLPLRDESQRVVGLVPKEVGADRARPFRRLWDQESPSLLFPCPRVPRVLDVEKPALFGEDDDEGDLTVFEPPLGGRVGVRRPLSLVVVGQRLEDHERTSKESGRGTSILPSRSSALKNRSPGGVVE